MKRYIYILLASIIMWSCAKSDLDSMYDNQSTTNEDGTVTLAFNLKLASSQVTSVSTRTTSGWEDKENVTKITGWAFVFENLTDEDGTISDDAKLLQKVAFKTTGDDADNQTVYVTLDEQTEACFIRLMTAMTTHTSDQITAFVSQKMYEADTETYKESDITTFDDYKDIDVTLLGYYQSADSPDPNSLTQNLAFPLASPGVSMPDGISEESVAEVDLTLYMVPVASKVDVNVGEDCDFKIQTVTMLNGAMKALMRSTVLENDGLTVIESHPLPTNLGGVTKFAAVSADDTGVTTEDTPIYFYPNEGDEPALSEDDKEYADEDLDISDVVNNHNPTYLIIKGRAEGYDVDGYYKIAIRYIPTTVTSHDESSFDPESDETYDIIRNNHYKVYLNKVDNPGYATEAEAIAGVANNISFDITVDSYDSRNETIVSDNGLYSMEFNTSSVYVRSYIDEEEDLDLDMTFWLGGNDDVSSDYYSADKAYITCSEGLTINGLTLGDADTDIAIGDDGSFEIDWDNGYSVNFSLTAASSEEETITIRYGNIAKEIPVYFENSRISMFSESVITVNGAEVFSDGVAEAVGTIYTYETDATIDEGLDSFFGSSGGTIVKYPFKDTELVDMANFDGRRFDGYVYSTTNSGGAIRLYCHQGSTPFHLAYELNTDPTTLLEPYYMVDYQDFDHLATSVNGKECTATPFTSCDFNMLQNIDLQEEEESRVHTAIGLVEMDMMDINYYHFSGNFYGQKYTVSNLYIPEGGDYEGLFGSVSGATIRDLTVSGSVSGYGYMGGVAGYCVNSTITSCTNDVSVIGSSSYIGGITGWSTGSTISYCTNNALIGKEATSLYIGGIVGSSIDNSDINNCTNNAKLLGYSYIGGIVGNLAYSSISSCTNSGGSVIGAAHWETGNNSFNIGGIVGYAESSSTVESCKNSAKIEGGVSLGGIAGRFQSSDISDCTNYGSVEKTDGTTSLSYVGGIVGQAATGSVSKCINYADATVSSSYQYVGGVIGGASSTTITYCDNYAKVEGNSYVGGVSGYAYAGSFDNCSNTGSVTSTLESTSSYAYAGGVVGYAYYNPTISNCTNGSSSDSDAGAVKGSAMRVGGIVGGITNCTSAWSINSCKNYAAVDGYQYVGGIIGYHYNSTYPLTISECTNSGAVASGSYVGGIAGYVYGGSSNTNSIVTCTNSGDVLGSYYVGGMAGNVTWGYFDECVNTGGITSTREYESYSSSYAYAGGIVGSSTYATIQNCTNGSSTDSNAGAVKGSAMRVAGIIGSTNSSSTNTGAFSITSCYNYADIEGYQDVGGMVGYGQTSTITKLTVSSCTNKGKVMGAGSYGVGGMIGRAYTSYQVIISSCTNDGAIMGYNAGGMVGYVNNSSYSAILSDCTNNGTICNYTNVKSYALGGIVGRTSSTTIERCNNNGVITTDDYGSSYIGGVAAFIEDTEMTDCINDGSISTSYYTTSSIYFAGLVGYAASSSSITSCVNNGSVTYTYSSGTSSNSHAGGLVSNLNSSTIDKCVNNGTVTSTYGYATGLCARSTSAYILNSCNMGEVNGACAYGIVGYLYGSETVLNNYNTGIVTGTSLSAGVTGYDQSPYGTAENCYNTSPIESNNFINRTSSTNVAYCYYPSSLGTVNNSGTAVDEYTNFVELLNSYENTTYELSTWVEDTNNINGGYPIFDWQQTTTE